VRGRGTSRDARRLAGLPSRGPIADRIVVTPARAKTHVSRAMMKLGARSRARPVVFAYEPGLGAPPADPAPAARRRLAIV